MEIQNAIQQPIEVLLQEIDLENQIRNLLDDTQIYFDYNIVPNLNGQYPLIKLDLITINKEHNHKFLFHSNQGTSKMSILQEMIIYIDEYKKQQETYAIEWADIKIPNRIEISWFKGNDIFDILNKFYYTKEKSQFKIFKIKLMPEA
ncbi:MAG: hypothetical protein EAZ44_02850 [Cytophagia bacterium]|nr:MAG: hypothetical protein EAY69_11560 [Cytophagales bacterium]TAG05778.1 MAG: hypothetical protein EAZ44_02850 [Cytophagia bacterium]TAG43281.1 MAG: hypothetical protein EAZ31_04645 [Cytophagia bacterium]TAH29189.1 MAG: hypothetical protein EAZ06_07570 [Cytophagales bacterium]